MWFCSGLPANTKGIVKTLRRCGVLLAPITSSSSSQKDDHSWAIRSRGKVHCNEMKIVILYHFCQFLYIQWKSIGSKQNNREKKKLWDILQNILYVVPQKEKSFNIVCLLYFPCVCNLFADRGVVSMSSANLWTPCQQMLLTVCILKQVCYESVSLMVRWWRVMSGMDKSDTALHLPLQSTASTQH